MPLGSCVPGMICSKAISKRETAALMPAKSEFWSHVEEEIRTTLQTSKCGFLCVNCIYSVSDFFTNFEPNACCGFLRGCFHVGNLLYPPDYSYMSNVLYSVCWAPVGPQDTKT